MVRKWIRIGPRRVEPPAGVRNRKEEKTTYFQ